MRFSHRPFLSSRALDWLQVVLRERLHPDATLSRPEESTLALRVHGSVGRILFDRSVAAFDGPAGDLTCGRWDAAAEGWHGVLGAPLPAPGCESLAHPLVEADAEGFVLHYDLPGLVWWALSRREEVGEVPRDVHGRFPANASHAQRHGYLERPVVDEWLEILRQIAARAWPGLELVRPAFEMRPSHDVDFPSRYAFRTRRDFVREIGIDLLRRHRPLHALRAPWIALSSTRSLSRSDPANTFDWLMDLSDRHSVSSAFYFICGRTDPALDASYEPEQPAIRDLMRRIHERGHEVGLHPSYGTFRRAELLVAEAQRLRTVCAAEGITQRRWGGRMHYLRWESPTTLRGWEQAGMDYDSTMGYADRAGFRCGTCHEYPAFDPVADRASSLRMLPLIAMDGTIMSPQYMGLGSGEAAYSTLARLKDCCRAVGGKFTLLWHNSELGEAPLRDLYRAVLAH